MPGILDAVADAFARSGVDLLALGLAWARVLPTVILVPAFGLRALPFPARGVLGLGLAAVIFPAVSVASASQMPWFLALLGEVLRGLPIAIAAAIPLWLATMSGGLIDNLRGGGDSLMVPIVEGRASPLGVLLSLLAGLFFFGAGGPARIAEALIRSPQSSGIAIAVAHDLSAGISIAVALAAPLATVSIIFEVSAALVSRAAAPAQLSNLIAPVRSLVILFAFAIVFDRIARLLADIVAGGLPS